MAVIILFVIDLCAETYAQACFDCKRDRAPQFIPMNAQQTRIALIVEDELFIVLELEETLQELGYDGIVTFSEVDTAMSWLRSGVPDVAIIDYHLKGEIADELIRALACSAVPTVIYSGRSLDPAADSDMLKACEWLTKPADEGMLATAIARARGLVEPATVR